MTQKWRGHSYGLHTLVYWIPPDSNQWLYPLGPMIRYYTTIIAVGKQLKGSGSGSLQLKISWCKLLQIEIALDLKE
jgi:hypothetical protein